MAPRAAVGLLCLKQAGKLLQVLGSQEEFKPADDRGSDCATAKQEFHGVGLALTGEVIDEGIRIGDGHRQFARVFLV